MSRRTLASRRRGPAHAPVFAALGDKTRLSLVAKLTGGQPRSISQLTHGTRLTRQAITKHLRVLEGAGLVHSSRAGARAASSSIRSRWPKRAYLERVSEQWDQALARLKVFVES